MMRLHIHGVYKLLLIGFRRRKNRFFHFLIDVCVCFDMGSVHKYHFQGKITALLRLKKNPGRHLFYGVLASSACDSDSLGVNRKPVRSSRFPPPPAGCCSSSKATTRWACLDVKKILFYFFVCIMYLSPLEK